MQTTTKSDHSDDTPFGMMTADLLTGLSGKKMDHMPEGIFMPLWQASLYPFCLPFYVLFGLLHIGSAF